MGFDDPAADGRPMSALTEGQIHDSAAEVVDAPLLILRIAQSRAETTRLIDWLRGMGARHASTPARTAHTLSCNFRLSHKPPLIICPHALFYCVQASVRRARSRRA